MINQAIIIFEHLAAIREGRHVTPRKRLKDIRTRKPASRAVGRMTNSQTAPFNRIFFPPFPDPSHLEKRKNTRRVRTLGH
jgi:hypothetical protein